MFDEDLTELAGKGASWQIWFWRQKKGQELADFQNGNFQISGPDDTEC